MILGSALLLSSPTASFTRRDKAYYLSEKDAAFVRAGLVTKITAATVASDGTIKVTFKITDPKGVPLDRDGVITPGPVSTSFIASVVPNGQVQYQAYTTRVQNSSITGKSATQASTDSGGTYTKNADGDYTYTFGLKLPASADRNAVHSIGVYSSRSLVEFDLGTQYADDVFTFIPSTGSPTDRPRDIVRTETCNKCHNPLSAHGGARRSVQLCQACHTPRTFSQPDNMDPDTGNTIDLVTMVHKIHAGAELPSVQAGGKYQIIGFGNAAVDFSGVEFPGLGAQNCQACHGNDSAAQKDNWLTKPSRQACGSCHDNVNFATGKNHLDLPQVSDNQCSTCHIPQGELEFDASIKGAHLVPKFSQSLPGLVAQINNVAGGSAGSKPTITFTLKDKAGNPVSAKDLTTLRVYWAGPTTDYKEYNQEDAGKAACDGQGVCTYTFGKPIPAEAKGTYTIYMEGYRQITLMPGTTKSVDQRDAFVNPVSVLLGRRLDGSAEASGRRDGKMQLLSLRTSDARRSAKQHGGMRPLSQSQ